MIYSLQFVGQVAWPVLLIVGVCGLLSLYSNVP